MLLQFSRRDHALIGKLLALKQPHIAAELLSSYQPVTPYDDNLHNIPGYFQSFCSLNDIAEYDLAYSRYNSSMVDNKRLFICCLVQLYSPQSLRSCENYRSGLGMGIAHTLNQTQQYISLLIKEVIQHYKVYDDFREKVDECVEKMKGGEDGKAD